jgi:hypothetical protein
VAEAAQERAVLEEVRPQHLREREDPLRVADIDKHLLAQERRQRRSPLGRAGGAQPTALAREGDEELGAALSTAHPGEAVVENAAVEIRPDGPLGGDTPEAVAGLEALLSAVTDIGVARRDETVEGCRLRLARLVEGAIGYGHGSRSGVVAWTATG